MSSGISFIVVMGVAGCGKSTIAKSLASCAGASYIEADVLHPAGNIEKMSQGIALTDEDRAPWLELVRDEASQQAAKGNTVVACSVLKKKYRDILRQAGDVKFVYLNGTFELIQSRMHRREGHFMPESLLESQFATLEDPTNEPDVITVDIDQTADAIVAAAVSELVLIAINNQ